MGTDRDKQKGINIPFAVISQLQQTHNELSFYPNLWTYSWAAVTAWAAATIDPNLRENTHLNPSGAAGTLVYVGLKASVFTNVENCRAKNC